MRDADASDGAGVDEALDACLLRSVQEVACAPDIGVVKFLRMTRPEAIIGGDMKDEFAAGDGAFERGGVA